MIRQTKSKMTWQLKCNATIEVTLGKFQSDVNNLNNVRILQYKT